MKTSYRLHAAETLPHGIRRIVDEQLADAVERLRSAQADDRDAAVHEARKATKKSRAVLRLVRDEIGGKTYKRDNRGLRDAARRMSDARDAVVLVETLDGLAEDVPVARRSILPLRDVLEERRRTASARVLDDENAMAFAAEEIEAVRVRIEDWRLRSDDFSVLEDGLARTYKRGRERFAAARAEPTDERMHEARKRIKDLWYHARVLKPVWRGPMDALVDAIDELGDLLGDDHDLAVLAEVVRELEAENADAGAGETVLTLIESRRAELRAKIWPLGRRLYADKPKAFVRRIGEIYSIWREETAWWVTPEQADGIRALLEARETGTTVDGRRARDRLRRHGIRTSDLETHLPQGDGPLGPEDFEELVRRGRVRVGDARKS